MVAFENKDNNLTLAYMSGQRNLASKLLAMQWNADSFIKEKKVCCHDCLRFMLALMRQIYSLSKKAQ